MMEEFLDPKALAHKSKRVGALVGTHIEASDMTETSVQSLHSNYPSESMANAVETTQNQVLSSTSPEMELPVFRASNQNSSSEVGHPKSYQSSAPTNAFIPPTSSFRPEWSALLSLIQELSESIYLERKKLRELNLSRREAIGLHLSLCYDLGVNQPLEWIQTLGQQPETQIQESALIQFSFETALFFVCREIIESKTETRSSQTRYLHRLQNIYSWFSAKEETNQKLKKLILQSSVTTWNARDFVSFFEACLNSSALQLQSTLMDRRFFQALSSYFVSDPTIHEAGRHRPSLILDFSVQMGFFFQSILDDGQKVRFSGLDWHPLRLMFAEWYLRFKQMDETAKDFIPDGMNSLVSDSFLGSPSTAVMLPGFGLDWKSQVEMNFGDRTELGRGFFAQPKSYIEIQNEIFEKSSYDFVYVSNSAEPAIHKSKTALSMILNKLAQSTNATKVPRQNARQLATIDESVLSLVQVSNANQHLRPGGFVILALDKSFENVSQGKMFIDLMRPILNQFEIFAEVRLDNVKFPLQGNSGQFPKSLLFLRKPFPKQQMAMDTFFPKTVIAKGELRSHIEVPSFFKHLFSAINEKTGIQKNHYDISVIESQYAQSTWAEKWPSLSPHDSERAKRRDAMVASGFPLESFISIQRYHGAESISKIPLSVREYGFYFIWTPNVSRSESFFSSFRPENCQISESTQIFFIRPKLQSWLPYLRTLFEIYLREGLLPCCELKLLEKTLRQLTLPKPLAHFLLGQNANEQVLNQTTNKHISWIENANALTSLRDEYENLQFRTRNKFDQTALKSILPSIDSLAFISDHSAFKIQFGVTPPFSVFIDQKRINPQQLLLTTEEGHTTSIESKEIRMLDLLESSLKFSGPITPNEMMAMIRLPLSISSFELARHQFESQQQHRFECIEKSITELSASLFDLF